MLTRMFQWKTRKPLLPRIRETGSHVAVAREDSITHRDSLISRDEQIRDRPWLRSMIMTRTRIEIVKSVSSQSNRITKHSDKEIDKNT